MENKKQELQTAEQRFVQKKSPEDIISDAISKGADLDKLSKLLEIKERWEANEARKAYNEAMSLFRANPPKIVKDKKVGYKTDRGGVSYSHATLANAVDKITPELSKYGLSASWRTKQNGSIVVSCRISHVLGHYEEVELTAPADTSGSKNSIQAIGSTITYLERYTLFAVLGLAAYDQDDDGIKSGVEYIGEKEKNVLLDKIADTEADLDKFLETYQAEDLDHFPKSLYKEAIRLLDEKKKRKEKKVQ